MRAACTISLVFAADVRVLVDPGGPAEREVLIGLLADRGVRPEDIGVVVCTHGHIDHVGNAGLFPSARFVLGQDQAQGNRFTALDLSAEPVALLPGVQVLATPGHTSEDISLLVQTERDAVAVAGDVFENGDPSDRSWREYSRNARAQARSRRMLLQLADVVVPGHGAAFRTATFGSRGLRRIRKR